ncbi:MAG TPA: lipid A biosynthesis acyltransferase, partial [Blastocatellia bacterium]|nr:lipid A biosynthesis acyltransferase [Blastocatellia bacterium]
MPNGNRSRLRNWAEFIPAWIVLKSLGLLPRSVARAIGRLIALAAYSVDGKLRRTAHFNLSLALPELSPVERSKIVRGVFRNLGNMLGEFSQFPKLTPASI